MNLIRHSSFVILLWSLLSLGSLHAQPFLKGPLTTNSPAIKTAATDGRIDALTNNFFRVPVEVNTNLVITNLALGQVIRIEVWPTNGFTVTFPQQTPSNSVQGWVQPLTSNQWNTVYVSRPDTSVTNFDIRAADYIETASNPVSRSTNFANRTVTTTATIVQPIPLQVQSAWRPSTNMATLEAGYQQWELQYPRTNAAGANVDLQARWQFNCPTNYVTNTLSIAFWSFITSTNGPNSSNAFWRATILRHDTAGGTATNDARVGPFDAGSSTLTTTWPADYQGTNKVQMTSVTISNCTMSARESGILKLERLNSSASDTAVTSISLVDVKLQCDTR